MKRVLALTLILCLAGTECIPTGGAPTGSQNPGGENTGPQDEDEGGGNSNGLVATFTLKKVALKATFDASGATSPTYTSDQLLVRWDFTDDGEFDTEWSKTKTATYTYPEDGRYTVRLQIKDPSGATDTAVRTFNIVATNTAPTAAFSVSLAQGMIASFDASSSSDPQDATEDLRVRWDFDGDNNYDTDWTTTKTAEYAYTTAGEYTVKLQVKDLNETTRVATQTIVASPITIRNSFLTYGKPYMVGLHFRMINNLTGQPVTPDDLPALTRSHFTIYENNVAIDLSETNQLLYSGQRPMFLVLILDFTGSMYDSGGVTPMLEAARAFIDSQGPNTYLSLWAFWERQGGNGEIADFTKCTDDGKAMLHTALDTFAAGSRDRGATEIWDLLKKVVDNKFEAYDTGVNRGIVFLSDGHDTTSATRINTLIDAARKKATFIFSVGMAFRSQEYPSDEGSLKKVAEDTGGLYFTVNQLEDLRTVFDQLSDDVNADWTLSYITLRSTGTHNVKVVCNYLDGYATMIGKLPITADVQGDIKTGLLLVFYDYYAPAHQTQYAIFANYIPRNISTIRLRLTSDAPAWLTLYETDSICKPSDGCTITPDVAAGDMIPPDGWYTITSPTPLEYGSWGNIARLTVGTAGSHSITIDLPDSGEQTALYGDKTLLFERTDSISITIP